MLTLRPIQANLQMDWTSLVPKEENNITGNTEDDKNNSVETVIQDAVSKHFEESLKKYKLQLNPDNSPSQNGFHLQNSCLPDGIVSLPEKLDVKDFKPETQLVDGNIMPPESNNDINVRPINDTLSLDASCSDVHVPITLGPPEISHTVPTATPTGQYDVESINTILKTIQYNCFINSSILKSEIKEEEEEIKVEVEEVPEEGPNPFQMNGRNTSAQICEQFLLDNANWEEQVKEETPPPPGTVNTQVDIEAELPCTSIQQKKKASRSRKKEDNTLEKPVRVMKQCSKRSTKRKTNYREASSDEEPKFIASSRSRPNIKATKQEIKKNSEQLKNENQTPKNEVNEIKTDSDIKMEPGELERGNKFETEASAEVKNEVGVSVQTRDLEIKTETFPEINLENGVDIKRENDCILETDKKLDHEIKTESQTEDKTNIENDIKSENREETQQVSKETTKAVRKPGTLRKRKARRFSAFAAASARNKPRLHPLTRQEQLVMNQLMETKEPFLQNIPCLKMSSKISKCRECRQASLRSDSTFCRFYDFRRLRYRDKGVLVVDGFSDPNKDPGPNDIEIWQLGPAPKDIDLDISRFILMHVGEQFCRIYQDEQKAVEEHMAPNKTIAWKKVVKGVREICDVCETTLFNFHWTCNKCGFGVCIDCYRDRKNKKKSEKPVRGLDDYGWLICALRESHLLVNLMLTQIIPGNALQFLAHRLHQTCKLWKIPLKCGCPLSVSTQTEQFAPSCHELADKTVKDAYLKFFSRECEVKYMNKIKKLDPKNVSDCFAFVEAETQLIEEAKAAGTLPSVLATTLKHLKLLPTLNSKPVNTDHMQDMVTKEYNCLQNQKRTQKTLPQKVLTTRSSKEMFPGIAHDWLCNGKLLRLLDSRDPRNVMLFQEAWKRGQPIMVSELCKFLNIKLWHPEAFCVDFGEKKNDLINCMTGNLVPNQPMKLFWEGFQCVSKRLLDSNGQPMLLKLKDWPPGDDFAEILPTRFKDLMSALPLPEYTLRTGGLNIASRLPTIFVPPDLGPKMYNAYGSALHPDKGTTNLHLDISDAVNIMVYVGIPTDASAQDQIRAALSAIDSGGCDLLTRRRVRQPGVMPGALWHIYSARDADKIRDLLNRVTIERGYRLEPDHDPIHDQNWYLDNELRERLYDDYGVEGFPIVQCLGDAVFIPAGAPHQVRNLHNCIKVAEDFVSPENIQHCFHLSEQFRKLSMSHTNHEDKLQIRNVIYHSIKDTTSYLTYLLNQKLTGL